VAAFLRGLGAEAELQEVEPGRPNVVAAFVPKHDAAAHLAFAPHLDTVSVAGMTIPPFDPVECDGKIFGRGASDTKGAMAAALWALREWSQSAARSHSRLRWTFLALMGEEAGNDGAHALAKKGFACDLLMALEPTELAVVTAHKGVEWLEITTRGVACHGSTPERGRNAILEMRRVLEAIEDRIGPALARHPHPKLGPTTVNVGTIAGGSKINIVPDVCRVELDCRYVPGMEARTLRRQIESTLLEVAPDVEVRPVRTQASPPLDTDETLPWVSWLGGIAEGFATAPWFSDASILSRATCPAVCLGPGSIAQAHTQDEFIAVRDLEEGAAFFRRLIDAAEEASE